jgi:CshA-type fibril repeat protein
MTKLNYADGTVATMSYTNVGAGIPTNTIGGNMSVGASTFWGGVGDTSTAYSPASLASGQGLIIGWHSFADRNILGCLPSTDTNNPQRPDFTRYPASPNPYVCSTPATVTFTFSRPTTNAILNLHNLAGGSFYANQAFYSSWTLSNSRSPGLSAELVSKVGNFEVAGGNTIKTIQPPSTGITDAVYRTNPLTGVTSPNDQWGDPTNPSTALDVAPQGIRTYYGSGSGAVRILGTYTSVSFDVTLRFRVNTELSNPYFWDFERFEYVAMNWNIPTAQPGTASPDTSSGVQGAVQTQSILTNDTARSGDPFTNSSVKLCNVAASTPEVSPNCSATSVTVPNVGTYAVNSSGVVTFTPLANFVGTAAPLPYTVTSGLGLVAASTYTPTVVGAPAAANDTSSGPMNQPQDKQVLTNDTSNTGTPLAASTIRLLDPSNNTYGTSPVTIANQGTYSISGDRIVFTPVTGYVGTATPVRYQVTDSLGSTANATYTPTIAAAPQASNDESSGPIDKSQSKNVLANDKSSTGTPIAASTIKLLNPATNTYGTSSVTIAKQGTYKISGSQIVFTPVKGFSGTATPIRYQVTDSVGQTANATYTPTITPAGVSAAASTLPDTGAQGIGVLTMFAIVISVIGCCAIVASTIWRRKTQLR